MGLELVSIGDLEDRWCYSRQGIHRLSKSHDFPAPAATINRGRQKVWHLTDIEAFESHHPEVLDEAAKRFKVTGYLLTLNRAAKREREAQSDSDRAG